MLTKILVLVSLLASLTNLASGLNAEKVVVYEKCRGPGDPGPCRTFIYKWRFEVTTQECLTFIWGGCHGNGQNRFDSEAECLAHCVGGNDTTPLNFVTTSSPKDVNISKESNSTEVNPVKTVPLWRSLDNLGDDLIFRDSENAIPEKEFMFAQNNTFIQIDGDTIKTFQLRLCREISFQFRTRLPHGLLVYHNVKNPEGIELDPYALYVIVEKGQLKVVHVFGKHSTSVIVGEGLNRDEWHNVVIRIDVHGARLIAKVDESQEEVYLKGLNHDTNYGVSTNLPSVVLVGGLSSEEKLHGVKYIIESFVGCIRNIVLKSGKAASDLLPITPLVASKHENVIEGCQNNCDSRKNLCFIGSRCVNHYSSISCDCFGTNYEGELCDIYSATVLSLRGSSYVSYRIYDWKDRTHSSVTRISLMFRTWFDDSILFYASGETIKPQYIAASIKNNSTYIEMDFGEGPFNCSLGNNDLTSYYWHNLTIYHDQKVVKIILDDQMKIFEGVKNLLFDPEIYFGGGPDLNKKRGLASSNNFAGSLKYVFYNDISILYELKRGNPKVHYIGVLAPEFTEVEVDVIPITYPFATSHIWWPIKDTNEMSLKFDFKSSRHSAILAYSEVQTKEGAGFWEIRLMNDKISFELVTENNMTIPTSIKIDNPTSWHVVEVDYANETLTFTVDYRHRVTQMYGLSFSVGNKIIIGSSLRASGAGLIGCMRDLTINNMNIEPRYIVKTERVVGEIALDNCQFVDPCRRPNTCEHNGKCIVKNDRVTCDCKGTGYEGKNCHFSKFRKTCEELALLGYTKSDVYLIDIDGNGVFPPVHVKCEFQTLEESTKTITIIEHNLPSQVDVRSASLEDFSYDIKYREFTAEMLQELISHSLYCTQHMKYDCLKAPLDLNSATWFKSSYNNNATIIDFIGNSKRGSCPCAQNKTCEDVNESCNCDKIDNKWSSDEGYFTEPHSLGITNMYFLQQKNLDDESQGRITLGPLECVETNTQKYVVTFTTSQSYIEVPGWRKGDIAFSFRTTGEKAILLFQPPIRPNFPSFLVALTGDFQLTFAFTLNTGTSRELVVNSRRKLNGGEWHKIWIDYNDYHVRFMINQDFKMVDLLPEEQFGPFEGSMFIGGATPEFIKKKEGLLVKQGLIGCFRGLVVNGEILDIYSYMSVHLSEIIKDCKPSCVPNPCKNGAQCKELWSNFQCVCKNPWAHVGENCETNFNEKALTFTNRGSYFKKILLEKSETQDQLMGILKENLLVNIRTYDKRALILYAHDNFNNFVHLYLDSSEIVYLYNYGNEIFNLSVTNKDLTIGKSIQIAIIRSETSTVLHVNEKNATLDKGVLLLEEYSNKPWINSEKEVLSPHRPPAPTVSYFQINLAGYDHSNLLQVNNHTIDGLIGCVRGLKIGNNLINLPELENEAHIKDGVLNDCQMYCDSEPCKNGGICTENFDKKESTSALCDCELTSFLGDTCAEDKGAEFSGESGLRRKYQLSGKIDHIKLKLAFSTNDMRRANRVMLLLQSEEPRYYLVVGTTSDNHLFFEEDRNGQVISAKVKQEFMDNGRHSVYYKRNLDEAVLLIDRNEIPLTKEMSQNTTNSNLYDSSNTVSIGGINSTDPRFAVYKSYSGCLSNVIIEVNNQSMKPLEEYMLFTRAEDNIHVLNPTGVRSAQCNIQFESKQKHLIDVPLLNISTGIDKSWIDDTPSRKPYKSIYIDNNEQEEQTQLVFIVLISLFFIIIIACIIEVYRTDKQYKKRLERETDEGIIWAKEQATKMHHESPGSRKVSYKSISFEDPKSTEPLVSILKNGNVAKVQQAAAIEMEKPEKIVKESNVSVKENQPNDNEAQTEASPFNASNLTKTNESNIFEAIDSDTELLTINDDRLDLGKSYAKYRQRQLSFPPPTNNTQLLFKLDEHEEEEDEDESESESNGKQVKFVKIQEPDSNDEGDNEENYVDDDEDESIEEIENEKNSSDSFEIIKKLTSQL